MLYDELIILFQGGTTSSSGGRTEITKEAWLDIDSDPILDVNGNEIEVIG